jgi:hypothetical protein
MKAFLNKIGISLEDSMFYVCGIIAWIVVMYNLPLVNTIPIYAGY